MKIKSILAISAFAASMSAFAQTTPPTPKAGAKQSSRSTTEKKSIRSAVQDFHDERTASTQSKTPATMPPMPAPRVEVTPDNSEGRSAAVRREQLRKSVQRHAQHQKWADRREAVDEAQRARLHKRQARLMQNKAPNGVDVL
jgi:hypothetical protein